MQHGDAAEGLTLHSLRHNVNITLKGNKATEKSVRLDIIGHAAVDLNEQVFSAGTPFAEKLAAINSSVVAVFEARRIWPLGEIECGLLWLPSLKQGEFDLWARSSAVFCQALFYGTVKGRGPIW